MDAQLAGDLFDGPDPELEFLAHLLE